MSEVELSDVVTDWRCPTVTFDSMTAMVLDGSEVVAVGQVIAGRAEVDVLPSHRGRGVGSALLPFTWDVARRDGRITVGQTVSDAGLTPRRCSSATATSLGGRRGSSTSTLATRRRRACPTAIGFASSRPATVPGRCAT